LITHETHVCVSPGGSRPTCLSICLSVYLSIYLSVNPTINMHVCMWVCMGVCVCGCVVSPVFALCVPSLSLLGCVVARPSLHFVPVIPSSPPPLLPSSPPPVLPSPRPPLLLLLFCLAPWRSQPTVSSIHFIPFARTHKQRARIHTHTYTCTHVFCGCELAFDGALYRPCQGPSSMPQSFPLCFRPRLPLSLRSLFLPDYFCSLSP
jgi:hypothetical protein